MSKGEKYTIIGEFDKDEPQSVPYSGEWFDISKELLLCKGDIIAQKGDGDYFTKIRKHNLNIKKEISLLKGEIIGQAPNGIYFDDLVEKGDKDD